MSVRLSVLLAILVSVLWGGNLISIRIGVDSVPPLWSAFWRMAVGVVIVTIWALHRGVIIRPAKGEGWPLFFLSVLFTAQIGLLNSGTAMTSPAFGVVILNSYAVFANITGHFFPGMEKPINGSRALGLALAIAGTMVLTFGQGISKLAPHPLAGNVLLILSAVLLGGMVLGEVKSTKPGFLVFAAILVGAFGLFHGHAHGTEMKEDQNAMLYSIGFVIATGILHACGITIGLIHRWPAGKLVLRGAGAIIVLGGMFFLWKAFAGDDETPAAQQAAMASWTYLKGLAL